VRPGQAGQNVFPDELIRVHGCVSSGLIQAIPVPDAEEDRYRRQSDISLSLRKMKFRRSPGAAGPPRFLPRFL
ncbi:hypothetical protein, partial [Victivallis lenta]|uniref:hypothetical protein n=1 Tax=Victivallis lenta TaxID=2606640 RepID=UPI003AB276DC